jgi:hypothetical protein
MSVRAEVRRAQERKQTARLLPKYVDKGAQAVGRKRYRGALQPFNWRIREAASAQDE